MPKNYVELLVVVMVMYLVLNGIVVMRRYYIVGYLELVCFPCETFLVKLERHVMFLVIVCAVVVRTVVVHTVINL